MYLCLKSKLFLKWKHLGNFINRFLGLDFNSFLCSQSNKYGEKKEKIMEKNGD